MDCWTVYVFRKSEKLAGFTGNNLFRLKIKADKFVEELDDKSNVHIEVENTTDKYI